MTKVFISYRHDSLMHKNKVLRLSNKLRRFGIDCDIDQYIESPKVPWPFWIKNKMGKANFVIIIFSKGYQEAIESNSYSNGGKGSKFEYSLMINDIYSKGMMNDKFIPVVFTDEEREFIPIELSQYTYYVLDSHKKEYERLKRYLTGQSNHKKPTIGSTLQAPGSINQEETEYISKNRLKESNIVTTTQAVGIKEIELKLRFNSDEFDEKKRKELLKAISTLLDIDGDISIKRIRIGSLYITLELSASDAERLLSMANRGNLEFLGISEAKLINIINEGRNIIPAYYIEQLKKEILRVQRYKYSLSIILIDINIDNYNRLTDVNIDDINNVNLNIINKSIRVVDILCKYKDGRFIVILPNTNRNEAMELANRLHANLQNRIKRVFNFDLELSIIVGQWAPNDNAMSFVQRLEIALGQVKESTTNKILLL
jgi:diguanylate cyclase (GGDEF)-like protein